MLDYGIKLNHKIEYPVATPNVDAFILSHAHLDHSGLRAGALQRDANTGIRDRADSWVIRAALEGLDEHSEKRAHDPEVPQSPARSFMHRYTSLDYHSQTEFAEFNIEFFDAGHICGSAITLIERKNAKENKRIVYTGDFKLEPQYLHKGAEVVESDVLIIESTYATREHPEKEGVVESLVKRIKETLENNGTVLLPVFAVGRSQEILYMLYKNNLTQYTYIDGMARTATSMAIKYGDFISNSVSSTKPLRRLQ